jgi:hypothetical protein
MAGASTGERDRQVRMACTTLTPTGMNSGDNTSRNVRMCGMYDIVIGLPLRQADWGKLAHRVGARLRRRATNSSREVVLWRQ